MPTIPGEEIYQNWLALGLNKPGKHYAELANNVLGIHPNAVHKIMRGDRTIFAYELALISYYIEEPIPRVGYGTKTKRPPNRTYRPA